MQPERQQKEKIVLEDEMYVVKKNDSLDKIAKKYKEKGWNGTWEDIYNANDPKIEDPNKILPGQKLKIPGFKEKATKLDETTTKKGKKEANIEDLASIIMSEASIGNRAEKIAVGYTVLNRMKRNKKDKVASVKRGFAYNQKPNQDIKKLAREILAGEVADNSGGATHFYSPNAMPWEGEENKNIRRLKRHFEVFNTRGGLEQTEGLPKRNYKPGWAKIFEKVDVKGTRKAYFKFHRSPGKGKVH